MHWHLEVVASNKTTTSLQNEPRKKVQCGADKVDFMHLHFLLPKMNKRWHESLQREEILVFRSRGNQHFLKNTSVVFSPLERSNLPLVCSFKGGNPEENDIQLA